MQFYFIEHFIFKYSALYVSQGKESSLPFIIFMALLLHKCPAAIGLTTFLLHENLRVGKIIPHLLAFTSTSPISAVVSYYIEVYIHIPNLQTFVCSNKTLAKGNLALK